MKKHLIFSILALSAFSIQAEGIDLACTPYLSVCENCPKYETIFPLETLSNDPDSLEIEADQSEMIADETFHFSGNVELRSYTHFISADDIKVSNTNQDTLASGNVKIQDSDFLITGDQLSAIKENNQLSATIANARYQKIETNTSTSANGIADVISKTPSGIVISEGTLSLCPLNKNDWFIKADLIELNLETNRGFADNVLIMVLDRPFLWLPEFRWVLEGRGTGFLFPSYGSYEESSDNTDKRYWHSRTPYYIDIAPDRDLLLALYHLSGRGSTFESTYRQLIAPGQYSDGGVLKFETHYLHRDYLSTLKRWLIYASIELDINDKTHLSILNHRVSDAQYFKEIVHGNTTAERLTSHIKLDLDDPDRNLKIIILSENEQIVNVGASKYTKTFEASVDKTFKTKAWLPLNLNLVTTRFDHKTVGKESGFRTYGNLGVTKLLSSKFPQITTNANINTTYYSLDNSDNITRTSAGTGIDLSFPFKRQTSLFGSEVIRKLIPRISYNYRAKKVQGNIPIFDTTDKYDDIITFSELTSGERYTGLDRITNANDVTLSFESSYRKRNALDEDKDLLNFKVAQSFYADTEVVSDTASTDYEARRSYSDIAASIDLSVNEFFFNTTLQFDPKTNKLIKKQNEFSYQVSPNNFLTFKLTNDGDKQTKKLYGSYAVNNSITLFAAVEKTNTPSTNTSTSQEFSGAVFETCCFAYRITHSKDDENGNSLYDYSTSFEVVLKGLGSTSNSIQRRIEDRIPSYQANNN